MPSTALVAFVKSKTGQAFLRSFTGAEAMFVRLTIEGLPGCMRVAAKLFPEETKREDG